MLRCAGVERGCYPIFAQWCFKKPISLGLTSLCESCYRAVSPLHSSHIVSAGLMMTQSKEVGLHLFCSPLVRVPRLQCPNILIPDLRHVTQPVTTHVPHSEADGNPAYYQVRCKYYASILWTVDTLTSENVDCYKILCTKQASFLTLYYVPYDDPLHLSLSLLW